MSDDKIINRIKKMLALANDSAASEGERDNALRMAYATMAKHNIDMAAVESAGQERRINMDVAGWSMIWSCHIHNVVGALFFCKYYRGSKINGTKLEHHFVGRESNAVTASYMASFIVTSVLKEGRSKGWHNLSAEMRSFGLGVAARLAERVEEIREAEKAKQEQTGAGRELVLASLYKTEAQANAQFLNEECGIRLRKSKGGKGASDGSAYAAGKEYGGKINLSAQVSGAGSSQLKLGV